jgi:hypothetical protein
MASIRNSGEVQSGADHIRNLGRRRGWLSGSIEVHGTTFRKGPLALDSKGGPGDVGLVPLQEACHVWNHRNCFQAIEEDFL